MNRELILRFQAFCNAARTNTVMLIELDNELDKSNVVCFVRRVGDDVLAYPVATLLDGELQPFKIDPSQLQSPLDPRRN